MSKQPNASNWPLAVAGGVALLGVIIFCVYLNWTGLPFTVQVKNLAGLLAPLAFAAAVVERAVEIVISPWRDAEANKLEKTLAGIQAMPAYPATAAQNALDQKAVSDALDDYRGQTQKYAFAVSITLGVLLSIAGVRAFWPFVTLADFYGPSITSHQRTFFACVDVAVSAALLAGGADGIHSIVNAVTSFFDASADQKKQQTAP